MKPNHNHKVKLSALALTCSCLLVPAAQAGIWDSIKDALGLNQETAAEVAKTPAEPVKKMEQASLLNTVTQNLGINESQASGALGSLFKIAQQGMSSDSFGQLSDVVPGMDGLLKKAPNLSGNATSNVLDSLSSLGGNLGAAGKAAGNLSMLNASLEKLGLSPELAGPLVTTVYQYVKSEGGQTLLGQLKESLNLTI